MDLSALDRHAGRIALSFSGGKDSLACVYLLRERLADMTLYHLDTGDLLPEVMEIVDHVRGMAPHFVTVRSDPHAWWRENGLPTDLLPYTANAQGQMMGEGNGTRLVTRYACCQANLSLPLYHAMKADGCTLIVRGTKTADMKRLPMGHGEVLDGVELFLPLLDWSHDQVFAYLREQGAPIGRIYEFFTNSPECATCPAWWNERRAAYLRERHPALFAQYLEGLELVVNEVAPVAAMLAREVKDARG